MRDHTAYYAMTQILDCNEVLEDLKNLNTDNTPDFKVCKLTELIMGYRGLLIEEMHNTTLEAYRINDDN